MVVDGLVVAPVDCHSRSLDSIEQSVYPFPRGMDRRTTVHFVSVSEGGKWRAEEIT